LTGNCSLENAFKIGFVEFFIKLEIYYFHERVWLQYLKRQATNTNRKIIARFATFSISGIILNSFNEIIVFIALTELV
jgi:uncharacterized membrane protein